MEPEGRPLSHHGLISLHRLARQQRARCGRLNVIRGVWWYLTGANRRSREARQRWEAHVGSHPSARRQERAREFGRRHPRLTFVIICAALAAFIAVCAVQIHHGTYLGRGWLIAATAGMATAAAFGAAAVISNMRHGPALRRLEWIWVALSLLSASPSGIRSRSVLTAVFKRSSMWCTPPC